ncbi:MAG TPA: ribonuclease P protein component [Syntrophales bacterium]|nr:ribonuclease P protein component [Syntrophales bacterium]HOL58281.1 ribonuclease P protein component [Syntrophales bacterium]HPO34450.1 ribonuclease P protein component [Syntrophales bacterium]
MPDNRFRKCERITKKRDFERVFSEGRRSYSVHFSWVVAPNKEGKTRFGIIAGRKVGRAVKRNRVKRLLREVFRLNKTRFPAGCDIIIIVKPRIPPLTYADVEREISGLYTSKTHD